MNEAEKEIAKLILEGIKEKGKIQDLERMQSIHDYDTFIGACQKRADMERGVTS